MRRARFTTFLVFAALIAGTGYCGGSREKTVLRFGLSGNPDSLDPQRTSGTLTYQVLKSVYDTLVEPDKNGVIAPALAEKWSISEDGRTWTFVLRRGVKFHDGRPFTANDVKATILRVLDKKTASPHVADFDAVSEVVVSDENTAVLKLSRPSASLLSSLASGWGAILPADLIASGHDFASKPVGTGPFSFVEWIRDNKIVLKKNPSYWMEGKPKIPNLEFRIIPERAVQVQGLLTGQIDAAELWDSTDVPILEKNPDTKIHKHLTSLVMVLAMNTSRPPLSDLKVRQAIAMAVDKQKVLDIAYGGGVPVGTFMDSSDPFYKDFTGLYPYDPERARKTLAEAANELRVLEMALPQNYDPHVRAGQMYVEMLEKIGIKVKVKLVDWSTWMSDVYRGANYDLTVIGHTGKLDPDSRLKDFASENNYVRWVNPEAARLIREAKTLTDFAQRKAIYDRVLEIMAREVPFVYVGTSLRYLGLNKKVVNFRMQSKLDTYDFRDTEIRD